MERVIIIGQKGKWEREVRDTKDEWRMMAMHWSKALFKKSKRGKSQEGSMDMDGDLLFAHWSEASSVRGTDDPKPETLPAVVHLPRPPWHWPNLHWLISFQALKCDLSATFLYLTTTNLVWKLSFLSVLMILIDLLWLFFFIYIDAYCIYEEKCASIYQKVYLTTAYLLYYCFFMVLSLDSEKAV